MYKKSLILIFCIFSMPLWAATSLPSTDVRFYRPFEALESIQTLKGQCTNHSTLDNRSDAWQCHANGRVLDPCFIQSYVKTKTAICPVSPWQKQAVTIELMPPLPSQNNNEQGSLDMSEDDPWAITLTNGINCLKLPSNAVFSVNGQSVKYACDNHAFLLGHIQRCELIWKMMFLPSRDSDNLTTVEISTAWY